MKHIPASSNGATFPEMTLPLLLIQSYCSESENGTLDQPALSAATAW